MCDFEITISLKLASKKLNFHYFSFNGCSKLKANISIQSDFFEMSQITFKIKLSL